MKLATGLEWWGGVECSVTRVGDRFYDQLEESGHANRLQDLDLFARLGFSALRFPLLWERTAPHGVAAADWSWSDERLAHLCRLGIRPIVGLVHHGSGPATTSLVSPDFPEKLAEYAGAVARRYPWLEAFTPVNEPLTTARFSGLYGYWYPHATSDKTFARALVNQCQGVVLAMHAIRSVNPAARLIQTEDLGKTYSTAALAYQAEFENQRRWLSLDLLCGRLERDHPLWDYLTWAGIGEDELDWFLAHPCPPDVIGGNYYLTSERFLDERLERYPAAFHGNNGQQAYADVEAVRVLDNGVAGIFGLLQELWLRYRRPVAVTEIHNGCTREEQMRWLLDIWEGARMLRHEGVDVQAVTAWSLLGAYDWNSLLTRHEGHYEPGVFDLRGGQPRVTALAEVIADLAHGRPPDHPVLGEVGWWRRRQRLLYEPVRAHQEAVSSRSALHTRRSADARALLILGACSVLGDAFTRLCALRGLRYEADLHADVDIVDMAAVETALARHRPWAVVNATGCLQIDDCEHEPERCFRENMLGPAALAAVCARSGIQLLTFSSDLVFDGEKSSPYVESDVVAPLNVYGQSKAEGEQQVLERHSSALVVRSGALFSPWSEQNFVTTALQNLAAGRPFVAAEDATISPTYVPDLVHTALDLLIDGESGLWHLANVGAVSWAELARYVAAMAGYGDAAVVARPKATMAFAAPRPRYSVLGSERASLLPTLDDALRRYMGEREI